MTDKKGKITIKDWDDADKPREKMMAKGRKSLSNAELIAILLGSGIPGESALDVAKEILEFCGNSLTNLSNLEIKDLKSFKGIGDAKAVSIAAAMELGIRMIGQRSDSKILRIVNSTDLFHCISPKLIDLTHEEFWVVYLNANNRVIWIQMIARGGITETTVDTRLVFKTGLEKNAVNIALAHNHPSGSLTPSSQDIKLTDELIKAGKLLHIRVIDHIIVGMRPNGEPDYYSFIDNSLI